MTSTTTEYLNRTARDMPERDLLEQVRHAARTLGLRIYHTHDSRRSEPGFPDLVIVGGHGALWRELKTQRGRLTPDQQDWLDSIHIAGQAAAVWRPADLLAGPDADQMRGARSVDRSAPQPRSDAG